MALSSGRYLAANNGGHNHHGSALGQWIEGGTWENAGDDTVHVNGLKILLVVVVILFNKWVFHI